MSDPLLTERHRGVEILTFNRPDRLNAWTDEMGQLYAEALARADLDHDVRVVLLTGAGRGFCSGMDVAQLADSPARTAEERALVAAHRTAAAHLRKPLIAAINGPAAGLGVIQAMLADIRFCAAEAKLTTAFAGLGLPAESGLAWLLSRSVGPGRAADLLLSARVLTGEAAGAAGLVEFVYPSEAVLDQALAYAARISERCSPAAMADIKSQLQRAPVTSFQEAVGEADALMLAAFERSDQREGARAYLQKRAPRFPPLGEG